MDLPIPASPAAARVSWMGGREKALLFVTSLDPS